MTSQPLSLAATERSRVLKVVEEMTFQMSILALNAAVETARSGEAGPRFAAAAKEVRRLAQALQAKPPRKVPRA